MQGYGDKKDVQDDGKVDRRAGCDVGIRFNSCEFKNLLFKTLRIERPSVHVII
jgi:hypothetical protein